MSRLLVVLMLTLLAVPCYSAIQMVDEDFEGVSGFDANGMVYFDVDDITDGEALALSGMDDGLNYGRPFHVGCDGTLSGCCNATAALDGEMGGIVETGGNPGQYARAITGAEACGSGFTEPKIRADDLWSVADDQREFYLKFDLKMFGNMESPHDTGSFEGSDFKFLRMTSYQDASAASSAYWHPQYQLTPNTISGQRWGYWGGNEMDLSYNPTVESATSLEDNEWHTYEIYINVGTAGNDMPCDEPLDTDFDGIIRVWEDNTLILENTYVPMRCQELDNSFPPTSPTTYIRSIAFIRHFKLPGDGGNLGFDNIEIWDGMPDEETTPGVTINCNLAMLK